MTSSIFARDLSGAMSLHPRDIIAHEIRHLKGKGQSRWRTNPLMATCRITSGLLFLAVVVLFFLDPFLYSIHKTRAINSYIYLIRFGDASQIQPMRESGMFSKRDLNLLDVRAQEAQSESVKDYYISSAQAEEAAEQAVAYMSELKAMETGDLSNADQLTKIRYHLFRHIGVMPPRQWAALNPVIEFD